MKDAPPRTGPSILKLIGPGILLAATGVGAGDLAAAAFTGSHLGTAILWGAVAGAALKFLINEGLARWQLATGTTFLEGASARFGAAFRLFFLAYLIVWTYFVGGALMSACGAAAQALVPISADPVTGKILWGLLHSAVAVVLVYYGGYRLFEKVMGVCIGLMFVTVVVTAAFLVPEAEGILSGLLVPRIPHSEGAGIAWTVALIGGVGGTLTILCYGYWIREEGRTSPSDLKTCRIDLGSGYAMTALFGVAMVIIGSTIHPDGSGVGLVLSLADRLGATLGPVARWAFLVGAWGAVASSLLGVWQSVPYLFADYWYNLRPSSREAAPRPVETTSAAYRLYLAAMSVVPAVGLWGRFEWVQKVNAIFGALFMPVLALLLLILNSSGRVPPAMRNSWLAKALLAAVLTFFAYVGWLEVV